jgi:capsid protein
MGSVLGDGKTAPPVFGGPGGAAPSEALTIQTPSGAQMTWKQAKRIGMDLAAAVDNNQVTVMPPDWELKEGQMTSTDGFPDFYKEMVREITIAFGTPFSLGANDTKGGSFSSEKIGLIQFKKSCKSAQQYLIDYWRIPAWKAMIRQGAAIGLWPAQDVDCIFIPPAFPIVDAAKELSALETEMNLGITSFDQACLAIGRDPKEQKRLIREDLEFWKEVGLPLGPGRYGKKLSLATAAAPTASDDEEDDAVVDANADE